MTCFAQEEITITTYYPSPYGVYNEMAVTSRQAIGDVNGDNAYTNADMAVDQFGAPIPGSLTVAGSVGIGTTTPQSKLDVAGGVRLGSDATCNISKAGTLRYNAAQIEYCDGNNWVTMGGGVSYTYYCFYSAPNAPVCTNAGGSQGYCPAGQTQKAALGSWGACYGGSDAGKWTASLLRPPGGVCGSGPNYAEDVGLAYVCSQ